jgi:hypothetical protein
MQNPGLEARPPWFPQAYGPRQVSSNLSILTVPVERSLRRRRRRVVPSYVFDPKLRTYVENPSPRPKSKVW